MPPFPQHRHRPPGHPIRCWLPLFLLLLILPCTAAAQQVGEYHIKAVFLTNLTHFVTWPQRPDVPRNSPFLIGILGPDPFETILDKAVAGETKNNRPIIVKRYRNPGEIDLQNCSILFISEPTPAVWQQVRRQIAPYPILSVADTPGFPEQGGMVNLVKNGQRIQVEINIDAVRQAGLSISSKLLSLARIVP